jgi:hypothetical protein
MPIEQSGFLCDYSLLSETDSAIPGDYGPRPKLRYINPDADWAGHKKVLVDPVTFFSSKDVAPPREVQILLNYFWAKLRENLQRDYELVGCEGCCGLLGEAGRFSPVPAARGIRLQAADRVSFIPF